MINRCKVIRCNSITDCTKCNKLHNATLRSLHKLLCNSEPLITQQPHFNTQVNVFSVTHIHSGGGAGPADPATAGPMIDCRPRDSSSSAQY